MCGALLASQNVNNNKKQIEKSGESELDELREYIKQKENEPVSSVINREQTTQLADIQTPPLPNTGMPVVQTAQLRDPNTNLTRTQQALLSPDEQIIASRRIT